MANLVSDVCNEALDASGINFTIGDISEGTKPAQILLRHYRLTVRQILRSAHWQRARREAPMTLLADATGQTPNVGNEVIQPWTYEYAYPIDCLKIRFIPHNNFAQGSGSPAGNISIPSTPLTPISGQPPITTMRIRPARFLVADDTNYPAQAGQQTWDVEGVSATSRTVVCTNVKDAKAVYTALITNPSQWDPLMRQAIVAHLAAKIALPLAEDKRAGLQFRDDNIRIAKGALDAARVSDGNEMWGNTDHVPDWIATRNAGAWRGGVNGPWDGQGFGALWGGWDACSFADGSSY